MKRTPVVLLAALASACSQPETGTLTPRLAFSISGETGLTAARDITVDASGNVFVFDYDDYVIQKFDSSGVLITEFGGLEGEADPGFRHLMAIRAPGDSLLALDEGSLSVFDLSGQLLHRRLLADTIVCDLPRIHPSGEWAGDWIVEETAENVLTYRGSDGRQKERIAGYALSELFPGVEPGGMFFISRTQALSYHYDFLSDGRLVWAASDRAEVLVRKGGEDISLYSAELEPIAFPPAEIQAMREEQAGLGPPLFMNVPEQYQLIQHLLVDEIGDIWVYLMSWDRTGFLHLTARGREVGFFEVEAGFEVMSARVTAANGRLYFLVADRTETKVYLVDRM